MFADDTTLDESYSMTNTLISKLQNKLERYLSGSSIINLILTGLKHTLCSLLIIV